MTRFLVAALLALFAFEAAPLRELPALAHEGHDTAGGVLSAESIERLEEHLADRLEESIRHGVGVESDDERRLGELLVDAAYLEVIDGLKERGEPGVVREAGRYALSFLKGLNPITLGKWLIDTGRRHGPLLAVTFGVSELAEQGAVLLSAKYPVLLFVVPLYLSHAGDVAVVALTLGGPKAIRAVKLWRRFGGLRHGPAAYYRHLLAQRQALPIDWTVVLHSSSVFADSGATELRFAVVSENLIERRLPRAVRVVLTPRKLASRESVPTFGIWELEKLARDAGVPVKTLRPFRGNKQLYATVLLRELALRPAAAAAFSNEVARRNATDGRRGEFRADAGPWARALAVDAGELLESTSEGLRRFGETPDLVAQRLQWFLRERHERLFQRAKKVKRSEEEPTADPRGARRALRKLARALEGDRGLGRIAATSYERGAGAADWAALYKALREARGLLYFAEESLPSPGLGVCERLLTVR